MTVKLTKKQEAFALAFFESGNATASYKIAYDSDGMKEATIQRTAAGLKDHPKIVKRLEELRAPVVKKSQMTLEAHLEDLRILRNKAVKKGQYSAAISAEVNRGKVAGFYVEKIEHGGEIKHVHDFLDNIKPTTGPPNERDS